VAVKVAVGVAVSVMVKVGVPGTGVGDTENVGVMVGDSTQTATTFEVFPPVPAAVFCTPVGAGVGAAQLGRLLSTVKGAQAQSWAVMG
jgi:hypothetical protein